jgi:AcrR family transcriptional regulator
VTRRSQAERSTTTKAALTDAAIALLVEHGWAGTTAVAVCVEAGVTRGALMHHYENLGELLAASLDRLYGELTAGLVPATTVRQAIDSMWRATSDPRFKAVLEAWWAAGNDPQHAAEIGPVVRRFATLVSPQNAAATRFSTPETATFLLLAREAMLGLAMGRATNGRRPLGHERLILDRLRAEADHIDAAFIGEEELTLS